MPSDVFAAFAPDVDALLMAIAPHIDDGMLTEIALSDYGRDMERHRAELVKIRDGELLPAPMSWHPAEVLELVRSSEPDDAARKPGRSGHKGHWVRAFTCAVLPRAAHDTPDDGSRDDTAVQLAASLLELNRFHRPAAALLASLMERYASEPSESVALLGYALLGLAIAPEVGFADDVLIALQAWCETRSAQEQQTRGEYTAEDWLVVSINQSNRKHTWQRLAERLANDLEGRSETLQTAVLSVASRLCGS